jgi:hypothetical protein
VRNAAAYALGNITVGNMAKFLPVILGLVKANADRRYALLASLKEIILQHSNSSAGIAAFRSHVATVSPILAENTEAKDEGVRLQVAACMGGLLVIDAKSVLPKLDALLASTSPFSRAVAITSLRYGLSLSLDTAAVRGKINNFLALLKDADLVRGLPPSFCSPLLFAFLTSPV